MHGATIKIVYKVFLGKPDGRRTSRKAKFKVVRLRWEKFEIYGSQEIKEESSKQMLSFWRRHCLNYKSCMTMKMEERNVGTFKMDCRWFLLIKFNPVCRNMFLSLTKSEMRTFIKVHLQVCKYERWHVTNSVWPQTLRNISTELWPLHSVR